MPEGQGKVLEMNGERPGIEPGTLITRPISCFCTACAGSAPNRTHPTQSGSSSTLLCLSTREFHVSSR